VRNAFVEVLMELAEADDRIVLLSGDIGNRMFDWFKERYPDRFYNCGVAEANMIGVAAGLALSGYRPLAYTIVPFLTARCLEQIRIDLCYHNVPVVLVGVGGGLSYGSLGATHHAFDDIGLLRPLPNMRIFCPADACEVSATVRSAVADSGPAYVRLGKKGEPVVHPEPVALRAGELLPLRTGREVAILNSGTLLPEVMQAVERLEADGVDAATWSVPVVKPLPSEALARIFADFDLVVTIEEHSLIGGFGAAVAEWMVDQPAIPRARLLRIGLPDEFQHDVGSTSYMRCRLGLDGDGIARRVQDALPGEPHSSAAVPLNLADERQEPDA